MLNILFTESFRMYLFINSLRIILIILTIDQF